MHSWDPALYGSFADLRLRPALDLLARAAPARARRVFDLGCGDGRVTRLLAERFAGAEVTGVDASEDMLDAARDTGPAGVSWVRADLALWQPPAPPDLVFANASLHWLDDHLEKACAWLVQLAPGGVLALQVPRATDEPSHATVREVLRDLALAPPGLLEHLEGRRMPGPETWHRALTAAGAAAVEAWETRYLQPLTGSDPVLEWVRGTTLRPVIDALSAADFGRFEAGYRARLRAAYPPGSDGVTLYPFPRVFAAARRAG